MNHSFLQPASEPNPEEIRFSTVREAIEAIRRGEMVIVSDDEDRENEGDLVCAADKVTPDMINFMTKFGRGLICLSMSPELCERVQLFPMVHHNQDYMGTNFTVSVDGHPKFGVTTGISAWDRSTTIRVAVAPDAVPNDLRRPGHIFPLMAKPGGVLQRVGQTEASVDLARLAGLQAAGVICEIMNDDGSMARRDELFTFAREHNLKYITVAQLVAHRLETEQLVTREVEALMPTEFGDFKILGYRSTMDNGEHVALVKGDMHENPEKLPLIRVHSQCLTGDTFGSLRCDCGPQLHAALRQISEYGKGAVIYMRNHEGRGIGLLNKIKAYALQEQGMDTVEANLDMGFGPDLRHYGIGAQIMLELGIREFKLLTNNPRKIRGLDGYGLSLVERVPLQVGLNDQNEHYLHTKQSKLGHLLDIHPQAVAQNLPKGHSPHIYPH